MFSQENLSKYSKFRVRREEWKIRADFLPRTQLFHNPRRQLKTIQVEKTTYMKAQE